MQQLQIASDTRDCARAVLEAVLAVLVSMREAAARRQRAGYKGRRLAHDHVACSLVHVRAMGVVLKRPGATLSTLADQLALTLSATSRLVDSLVERRLLRRDIPRGNRRTVSLHLTASGAKTLERAIAQSQMDLAAVLQQLPAADRRQLCRSMRSLQSLFDADSAPPAHLPR